MEELTIEEKASRYDKAIKVINKCETDKYGCIIGVKPTDIFPELKESEDEKIRKVLFEYFVHRKNDDTDKTWYGLPYDKIIAWFEKQGKQKPANKIEPEFRIGDWIVNTITGNVEQIIDVTSNEYICS